MIAFRSMRVGRFSFPTTLPMLCAGVACWSSFGAISFSERDDTAAVYGLLPSFLWLAVCVCAAVAVCLVWRPTRAQASPFWLSAILFLPWLPLPLPTSVYIWAGGLRLWIWGAIACIAAVRTLPCPLTFRRALDGSSPRRAAGAAGVLAATLFSLAAWSAAPQHPAGDEPHYLVITQSLLLDHDLMIENNHRRGDYRAYIGQELRPDYLQRGKNGAVYSVHAPGLSALVVPAFALFGYPGVVIFLIAASTVAAVLTWHLTWVATGDAAAAWFGWAAATLSIPFFVHASAVYPDGLGALAMLVGIRPIVDPRGRAPRSLALAGIALASLPWLHTRFVFLAGAAGLVLAARLWSEPRRAARLAALFAAPLLSATAWLAFFYVIYGTPNPAAPYGSAAQTSFGGLWRGITGLFVDQQFGILSNAPVFLCALGGIGVMWQRGARRLAIELVMIAAPYFLTVAAFHMWWAGYAAPARFLVPLTLPLAVPMACWFASREPVGRVTSSGLLLVSLAMSATVVIVERGVLVHNFRDGASRLLVWLAPVVDLTKGLPSLFQNPPSVVLLQTALWVVPLLAAIAAGRLATRLGWTHETITLAIGATACVASTCVVSLVWRSNHSTAVTPASGGTALLRRYAPEARQIALELRPMHRVALSELPGRITLARWTPGSGGADDPLAFIRRLPIGTYEVSGTTSEEPAGHLRAVNERQSPPMAEWNVRHFDRQWRRTLRLPVVLESLRIDGDPSARYSLRSLIVRAVSVPPVRRRVVESGAAIRAARYGSTVLYYVDGRAYVESDGTWVRGGDQAGFVLMPDEGTEIQLFIRNTSVPNRVTVTSDAWHKEFSFQPRDERLLVLPHGSAQFGLPLTVTASAGARPSEVDPTSDDQRFLGVWLETR